MQRENDLLMNTELHLFGLAGFLLPYMFIFRPSILAQGTTLEIIQTAVIATLAIAALSAAMYGMPSSRKLPRIILGISAFVLLSPGMVSDLAGLGLLSAGYLLARKMPDGVLKKSSV